MFALDLLVSYIDNERSVPSLFRYAHLISTIETTQVPRHKAKVLGLVPLFLTVLRLGLLHTYLTHNLCSVTGILFDEQVSQTTD